MTQTETEVALVTEERRERPNEKRQLESVTVRQTIAAIPPALLPSASIVPLGVNREDTLSPSSEHVDVEIKRCAAPPMPGAYAFNEGTRHSFLINDRPSLTFGVSTEFPSTRSSGLVQAYPVCDSFEETLETARPLETTPEEQQHQEANRSTEGKQNPSFCLKVLGLFFVVLVIVLVSMLLILSVTREEDIEGTNLFTDAPPEMEPILPWTWDLPFEVSESTLDIIRRDENGTSPQFLAYRWVKEDPYLATYTSERLLQRFALVLFYYSTNGENWAHQGGQPALVETDSSRQGPPRGTNGGGAGPRGSPNHKGSLRSRRQLQHPPTNLRTVTISMDQWLSYEASECDWFSTASVRNLEPCNDASELVTLDLMNNNLVGSLPEELGLLTNLESVKLKFGGMGGTIVASIGSLTNLKEWCVFEQTEMFGTVPTQIGSLSNTLKGVTMINTQLTGSLPKEFWQLSHLQNLKYGRNQLTGTLPMDIGERMPDMEIFMAARNKLSGSLPPSLGMWRHATKIDVNDNQMTGSCPLSWAY